MPTDHLTAILAQSRHDGSHLLVLLVIAINAGPHGVWLADSATLQKQVRLSRRRIQRILADLVAAGELAYVPGKGRGNRSTFQPLIPHTVAPPPPPPFPPDPLSPPTPQKQKPKTEETFGLARRPLAGQQRAVLQVNRLFHQAGIPLPPPAQIVLWTKTLGGIEPLLELLDRLIRAGLATKNIPAAYVHRIVMKPTVSPTNLADTRHRQAARLAGLPGVEPAAKPIVAPVAERRVQEHRPPSRRRRSRRSPR